MDEAALFEAVAASRLAGAALDVFAHEPYAPIDSSHDLRLLPNVITPHVGSHTTDANRGMAARAAAQHRARRGGTLWRDGYDRADLKVGAPPYSGIGLAFPPSPSAVRGGIQESC